MTDRLTEIIADALITAPLAHTNGPIVKVAVEPIAAHVAEQIRVYWMTFPSHDIPTGFNSANPVPVLAQPTTAAPVSAHLSCVCVPFTGRFGS